MGGGPLGAEIFLRTFSRASFDIGAFPDGGGAFIFSDIIWYQLNL
jgi:hypothetical protein